jgi:hypothetical protein
MDANEGFQHDYSQSNLVKSTCPACGAMVGAAADPFILQLLEEAHRCKASGR